MATPLFFCFLHTGGILSTIFLALAGAALLSSFSVTVVAAQEAIPDNKALAAVLTMGLAGGLGGFAVIFLLPIIAGLIGLFMKSRPTSRSKRQAALK